MSQPDLGTRIERALMPGAYIDWRGASTFLNGLYAVADRIDALVPSDPERAVELLEDLIGGCFEKAEEVDDSGGELAMFVGDVFKRWVRARQAAGADPEDTVRMFLAWEAGDNYGFFHAIEREAVEALDAAGLAAYARELDRRFMAASTAAGAATSATARPPGWKWARALRAALLKQGDLAGYLALIERTELEAKDCLAIATMLAGTGDPTAALEWVDRGLELVEEGAWREGTSELKLMRRDLLLKLGRGAEVVADAWATFQAYPSTYAYETLMKVAPAGERETWRERAMAEPARGGLDTALSLWLMGGATERLVAAVEAASDEDLEKIGHNAGEAAAASLETSHPMLAARLYRAQGWRILARGKSKYYDEAITYFAKARACYAAAGQTAAWDAVVEAVYEEHSRKRGFLGDFERMLKGPWPPAPPPSIIERGRARLRRPELEE